VVGVIPDNGIDVGRVLASGPQAPVEPLISDIPLHGQDLGAFGGTLLGQGVHL
jgi:hypothetical protein